ncbi:UDP-glucose 4-epimerase GalE [Desertimonas flava]|uniref:UDP-glucose 4-epimerase GalE n=1 Tax=Desertimonas flava TaxID=2064846 RepID=UPI000E355B43|nr:UDP-glucose 4-epimerase GalE [Desertimonas flava]
MSVLVTGGAGYIGSHTVRRLHADGADVVVLDTLELGYPQAIPGIPLVRASIDDVDAVTAACKEHRVTQVIHFAGYKSVGESMELPTKYWINNVAGTATLVDTMLGLGVDQIVFSSSCSVNGTPDSVPVAEDAAIRPESVYAASKAMVEQVLGWYGVTHGLRSVSLRYFNAAGAEADGRHGEVWDRSINLVPVAMKAALGRRPPLQVFADDYPTPDGTCIRDYIHVDDLADAHVRALAYLAGGGASIALNVGTGIGSSVLDVIKATERAAGRPVPHDIVGRRAGDPVATYADPTLINATLGWTATKTLDDIVETAWRWHSTHLDGYG